MRQRLTSMLFLISSFTFLSKQGNVNLRTCFADIRGEALFPVHVAVIGGSMELVEWMVDTHLCPITAKADPKTNQPLSVQTSAGRTLLDLAMSGRPKYDILTFLLRKGLSITDVKDPQLAPRCLENLMKSGFTCWGITTNTALTCKTNNNNVAVDIASHHSESLLSIEDACHICFERQMDCVFTPCGHQLCCSDCAEQMNACPICKAQGSFLRVFRQ